MGRLTSAIFVRTGDAFPGGAADVFMFVSLTDSYEKPQLAQFRKFATTHVPTDYAAAFAALQPVAVRYYVSKRTGAGACCHSAELSSCLRWLSAAFSLTLAHKRRHAL